MKAIQKIIISCICVVAAISSCGRKPEPPVFRDELLSALDSIDAFLADYQPVEFMENGYEVADPIDDSLVRYAMLLYQGDDYRRAIRKYRDFRTWGDYDDILTKWNYFKRMCRDGEYKDALDYYLYNPVKGKILYHLQVSSNRHLFLDEVIKPLMEAYLPKDEGLDEYIKMLEYERFCEEVTILLNLTEDGIQYMPPSYPMVLMDLGVCHHDAGDRETAFEFADLVESAFRVVYANPHKAHLMGQKNLAMLYAREDNTSKAILTIESFMQTLDSEREQMDEQTYASLRDEAMDFIEFLKEQYRG